ncbi:hypothetical protein Taro_042660 [Colocasia esculenta]|uniref:Uncharacterized protein n=1 Tax=Colocasia esculenta TaxID=4460 RepID=A0A843WHF8_COLES|nr:hypothetical protein [Colocasia esculenta]
MRQEYASRFERDSLGGRVPVATVEHRHLHAHQVSCAGWPANVRSVKATAFHVAFRSRRGASALVTLMERIAHNCGTVEVYVVFLDTLTPVFELVLWPETLEVPGMDLQLCVCRFDSFEVCLGVGTVVTAVVVCGLLEWWHSFGYGWYLYPVWVVWCDLPLNVLYPSLVKGIEEINKFGYGIQSMRRILNATALVVAFLLPPLSIDVCMHAKCRALGGLLTSGNPGRTELSQALFDQGGSCCGISWRFKVLVEFLARSRREDVVRSGGNAEGSPIFTFFTKVGYWTDHPVVHSRVVASFLSDSCFVTDCVVTAVVVCGVPEWWHSFGYGWYLYPVWVVWCDLPLNVLYPSSDLDVGTNQSATHFVANKTRQRMQLPTAHKNRLRTDHKSQGNGLMLLASASTGHQPNQDAKRATRTRETSRSRRLRNRRNDVH